MKSVIYCLESETFPRIRIGAGKPEENMDLAYFILKKFSKEESNLYNKTIESATAATIDIITSGIDFAMNKYNGIWLSGLNRV